METRLSHTVPTALLDERAVAGLFGVTPRTVRRWAARGVLSPVRIGGVTRYVLADIEHLIAGRPYTHPQKARDPAERPGRAETAAVDGRYGRR